MSLPIRVAILCPVHKNISRVAAQIDNYFHFHGDNAFHILHLSKDGDQEIENVGEYLKTDAKVMVNKDSWPTSFKCAFAAFISNTRYLKENFADQYTHVYLHTDGDLLFHGNLLKTIDNHQNCYSRFPIPTQWSHYAAFSKDSRILSLSEELSVPTSQFTFGRQEGSFFQANLWHEMMDIAERHFPKESFEHSGRSWAVEEVFLSTIPMKLLEGKGSSRPVIRTKELQNYDNSDEQTRTIDENMLMPEDIMRFVTQQSSDYCAGMKWFSPDLEHPSRQLVQKLLSGIK